jgi:hypothetical protein
MAESFKEMLSKLGNTSPKNHDFCHVSDFSNLKISVRHTKKNRQKIGGFFKAFKFSKEFPIRREA